MLQVMGMQSELAWAGCAAIEQDPQRVSGACLPPDAAVAFVALDVRRWPSDRDSGTPNTVSAADWTRVEPEGYETNMWFHWNSVNDSIQIGASGSLGLRAVDRL